MESPPVKLGLLSVRTEDGETSPSEHIEASRVVRICRPRGERPGGPTCVIRLSNGETRCCYDDPDEVAAQYSQIVERRYSAR